MPDRGTSRTLGLWLGLTAALVLAIAGLLLVLGAIGAFVDPFTDESGSLLNSPDGNALVAGVASAIFFAVIGFSLIFLGAALFGKLAPENRQVPVLRRFSGFALVGVALSGLMMSIGALLLLLAFFNSLAESS